MIFYRSNRVDGAFDAEIPDLAAQFWASRLGRDLAGGLELPLERALRAFLTDPEGFDSTWDDEASFSVLFETVRTTWPKEPS